MGDRTSRRKVTIREVAERAQVSISTVSHAFSGVRPISQATRDRVFAAAGELGYDPNPSARSLRTGRSGLVGLVLRPRYAVAHTRDRAETFNRLVGSVATEMLRRKVGLIHVPDLDDPATAGVPMDGCLVAHPYGGDGVLTELLRRNVPVVTIEEDPERPALPWAVRLDYTTAVTALLDHLAAQGADRIALLTGSEDNAWNRRPRETHETWCAEHGRSARTALLSESLSDAGAAGRIRRMLAGRRRPDAVVVATSDFAAIVTQVADELGLRVPDDLMVAALTDSEHSRRSHPPITAMDLSHEHLAAAGVDLMLARLAGAPTPDEPVVVAPDLRLRASTRRAGADDGDGRPRGPR
ncbi:MULTISPECIES: LacI family DNA-binding transcriptional regulator [Streptomyces]|uniref:Transcriptional regulator n=1 Tax=Streptomyces cacaoi TaxID=1898 RepID=A0A4Y3QYJ6_STRCI|nr:MULTISPECIES: LacI family DNA-binding transcriptional regulator [Streptomyces]NNG86478.1 LacI family transcriptional regulator [Streptomyces cacaoi]QHF95189.1 LacI family transcriptional regulator [Streptomyces sp. NHF165]GEB49010.1 transcriptional regulator [Streptomyces cacaoi]